MALAIGRKGNFKGLNQEGLLEYLWPNIWAERRDFGFERDIYLRGIMLPRIYFYRVRGLGRKLAT